MTSAYGFTALTTHDRKLATKKFTKDTLTGEVSGAGYGSGYYFQLRQVTFTDLRDLHAKLVTLQSESKTFIVRGTPRSGVDLEKSRRLLYPDVDEEGTVLAPATFEPCVRAWAMLDVDLSKTPAECPNDLPGALQFVLNMLPGEIRNADLVYSWGSSYKVTAKLSIHLFVLLDRAYSDKELASWAKSINAAAGVGGKLVDDTVFRGVQPHYTAAPVFSGELTDPLGPHRIGLHIGSSRTCKPVLPPPPPPAEDGDEGGLVPGGGFVSHLSRIGTDAGFYRPILSAIAAYIGDHGRETKELVPILQQAIRDADPGGRNEKDIATYTGEAYLRAKIKWVEHQEAQRRRASMHVVPDGEIPDDYQEIIVQLEAGELPRAASEAEVALQGSGIYQRGSSLVRLIRESRTTVPGVCENARALVIASLDSVMLIDELTQRARFMKFNKKKNDWAKCDAPTDLALTVLSRAGHWRPENVSYLVGILGAPTIRPDGSVVSKVGYDEATGLYFDADGYEFPHVPDNPTREDAKQALAKLLGIIVDFPFEDETDRAAAIAAMVTGLVRKSIYSAPLFIFSAPKPRSGKSKLSTIVGLLATGHRPAMMTYKDDPAEEAKRFMSLLMAGDPVINIDNISADLGGDALCTILTEPVWTDRLLGRNDASARMTVSTCATFTATGNNLVVRADLASRTLPCRIDPKVEHPEERIFSFDPVEETYRRRGELVVAVLTIVRAYQLAGSPAQGCPVWGGFEKWTEWVRDPLVWLGMADAAAGRRHVEDSDPIHQDLISLLTAWRGLLGKLPTTIAGLLRAVNTPVNENIEKAKLLREAILNIAGTAHGDINTRRLGKFIASHANRIEGGMCFKRSGLDHKVVCWVALEQGELPGYKPPSDP